MKRRSRRASWSLPLCGALFTAGSAVISGCVEGTIDGDPVAGDPGSEAGVPNPSTETPIDGGGGGVDARAPLGDAIGSDAPGTDTHPAVDTAPPPPPVDSSGYPVDDPAAPDTHQLSADLAEHLTISEVASFQSLKVPLARDGVHVPHARWEKIWGATAAEVPVVAGRDTLLRIYVKPEAGWAPALVTARVKLQVKGDKGLVTQIFYGTKTVTGASSDGDLGSTINVKLPGSALVPGVKIGVVLNAPGTSAPPSGKSSARYPQDGSLDDLGVSAGGDVMKVVFVPMKYNGDGSGRLPDTNPAQLKIYQDQFFRKYPVARVDVSVHATVDYDAVITKDHGIGDMLNAISALHDKDGAASSTYYVGLLQPAAKFWDFCGTGCVAGLSFVGAPASVWWGYTGTDWAGGTGAHEVGHAHGLPHAPCGTDDPDWWPSDDAHAGAKLGAWGWDPVESKLFSPDGDASSSAKSTNRDVMSYCGPTWIGDFNYAKLWHRVQADNGVKAAMYFGKGSDLPRMESLYVGEAGHSTWEKVSISYQPWMENGELRTVTVVDADGRESKLTGYWFPYDHLPGGHLVFPELPSKAGHFVRFDTHVVPALP